MNASVASQLAAHVPAVFRRKNVRTAVKPKAQSKEDIYVGKGRFIKDDPAKYPDRNIYSGGWAGGEAGLWALREQVKQEKASTSQGKKEAPKRSGNVYIGKGRFINDDARKYADKDSVLVGGFAGGEEGLQMFIEKGDIDLLPEGESRRRVPALLVGFLIATIGGASSVIVNNAGVDITQLEPEDLARFINSFQDNLPTALIPVGIAAAGLVAGGAVTLSGKVRQSVSDTVEKLLATSLFLIAFAIATTYVVSN